VTSSWEALLSLQRSGELITYTSGLKVYPDMAITSVAARQDKENPDHLRFTAMLEELRIVQTSTFEGSLGDIIQRPKSVNEVAKGNAPTQDRGAPLTKAGKKVGAPVTSAAKKLIGLF